MADTPKKQWTQESTNEFMVAFKGLMNKFETEYGKENFYDHMVVAIVAKHPEHSIDGVMDALAYAEFGRGQNVMELSARIIQSLASGFSEDMGYPYEAALAVTIQKVIDHASSNHIVQVGKGIGAKFPTDPAQFFKDRDKKK